MKKKILLIPVTVLLFSGIVFSQSPLPSSKTQLNFGVGISGWGIPVYLGLDYSIYKDITVGGEFSYRSYRENWKNYYYYNHNIIGVSGNGNYHFNSLLDIPQKWDFYAGLNLGFYLWSSPELYYGSHASGLGLGIQIGGRYYFTNKIGLNLELGGGNVFSDGKIGLSIKL